MVLIVWYCTAAKTNLYLQKVIKIGAKQLSQVVQISVTDSGVVEMMIILSVVIISQVFAYQNSTSCMLQIRTIYCIQ